MKKGFNSFKILMFLLILNVSMVLGNNGLEDFVVLEATDDFIDSNGVLIAGNDDLVEFILNKSLTGNGSPDSPYKITGFNFSGKVSIHDTDLYITIEDCYLTSDIIAALYLTNITNMRISNNTIKNSISDGIKITYSNDVVIEKNVIDKIENNGIYLYKGCENVTLTDNIISKCRIGIHVDLTERNLIKNNVISDNTWGIQLYNATDNLLFNNSIKGSQYSNIYLISSSRNNISNNLVSYCDERGIDLVASPDYKNQSSDYNYIYNNTVFSNQGSGLSISESSHNLVVNNIFDENGHQEVSIYGNSARNNSFTRNDFIDTGTQIKSHIVDNSPIDNNNLFQNNYYWHQEEVRVDSNDDEILDYPYDICKDAVCSGLSENQDYKPLVYPIQFTGHLLSPPQITSPNSVNESLNETLNISWIPAVDSLKLDVKYSIFFATNTSQWTLIVDNLSNTSYTWNTVNFGVRGYDCKIKVVASSLDLTSAAEATGSFKIGQESSPAPGFSVFYLIITFVVLVIFHRKRK